MQFQRLIRAIPALVLAIAVGGCLVQPLDTECGGATGCDECGRRSGCGWCDATRTCSPGNSYGPYQATCAAYAWEFSSCSGSDDRAVCASHVDCSACAGDGRCGWCTATGRCLPGTSGGPAAALCPVGWKTGFGACRNMCPVATACGACVETDCAWCLDTRRCVDSFETCPSYNGAVISSECP